MKLGELSAKYESCGDPASVSAGEGDAGGVSYGCYQLATNVGSVDSFVGWLQGQGHPYGDILGQHPAGTPAFSAAWIYCAESDAEGFEQLQHDYIQYAYYEPAVESLRGAYFNVENHSEAMKQVIWSRAVQYGNGNIVEMFEDAVHSMGHENLSYVDAERFDADLIRAIYMDVCSTEEWTNGSPSLREGLYNRFQNECDDALAMLA